MTKPEKQLQDKVIRYLRDRGIYYLNLYGDGRSGKGKPDLIVCLGGQFVAFELKVGANGLQDDQVIHKRRIERSGGRHFTPYSISEFIQIIQRLEHEKN